MAISWYHSSTCTARRNIVPGDSHGCCRSLGMTWFSVVFRKNRPGCYRHRVGKAIALPYRKRLKNFREGQDPPLRICVFRMTWFSVAFRNNRPGDYRRRVGKAIALPYRRR